MKKEIDILRSKCYVCGDQYYHNGCGVYGNGGRTTCSPWCENVKIAVIKNQAFLNRKAR